MLCAKKVDRTRIPGEEALDHPASKKGVVFTRFLSKGLMSPSFIQSIFLSCVPIICLGQRQRGKNMSSTGAYSANQTVNAPCRGPSDSEIRRAQEAIRLGRIRSTNEYHRHGPAPLPRMVYGGPDDDISLGSTEVQASVFNTTGAPPPRPLRHMPGIIGRNAEEVRKAKEEVDSTFVIGEDEDDDNRDVSHLDLKVLEDKAIADVSKQLRRNLCIEGHPLNSIMPEEEATGRAESSKFRKKRTGGELLTTAVETPNSTVESTNTRPSTQVNKDGFKESPKPKFDHYWKKTPIIVNSTARRVPPPRVRSLTAQFFDADANLMTRSKSLEAENLAKKAAHHNTEVGTEDGESITSVETPLTPGTPSTIIEEQDNEKKTLDTPSTATVIVREQGRKENFKSKVIVNESDLSEIDLSDDVISTSSGSSTSSSGAPPKPFEEKPKDKPEAKAAELRNNFTNYFGDVELPKPTANDETKETGRRSKFTESFGETELPQTDEELVNGEQMAIADWKGKKEKKTDDLQDKAHELSGTVEMEQAVDSIDTPAHQSRRLTHHGISPPKPRHIQTLEDELAGYEMDEDYGES